MKQPQSPSSAQPILAPLQEDHAADVRALYLTYRTTPYPENKIAQLLRDTPGIGAWLDGRLIGFAYFEHFAPGIIELGSIFVHKDHRNAGLGGHLMRAALTKCRDIEMGGLVVTNSLSFATHEPKKRARAFYLSHGFELVLSTAETDLLVHRLGA